MQNTRFVNIGDRFSRLVVLGESSKRDKSRSKYYFCKCDCGKIIEARKDGLFNGRVKSCGCFTKDRMTKHKMCNSRLYHIRNGMIARCYNKNDKNFNKYGGRGIIICDDWKNSFEAFYNWAINNGYADNLSIDRIDVNGNYEPSNCRWATAKQQANNTRFNHCFTYNGVTRTIQEWADLKGVKRSTLHKRIERGIMGEDLFSKTPVYIKKTKKVLT